MFIHARFGCFLLVAFLGTAAASVQENSPRTQAGSDRIYLDVVVTAKSGAPVAGLQQQDFTVLDNKAPQAITSFQAVTRREIPTEEGILVIDAVNAPPVVIDNERAQIEKFLRAEGGHLAFPIVVAVVTNKGAEIVGTMSSDGNEVSAALQQESIGLPVIRNSTERMQICLKAMHELMGGAAASPVRRIIVWISPGWPVRTPPNLGLDTKQQKEVFSNVVAFSTELLQARATVYSIDPHGAGEAMMSDSYYQEFLKGVSKLNQVELGDIGLPVLATQSGGIVFSSSNDIAGDLQKCVTDSASYYEISFERGRAEKQDEYHHLEIKLAKPGLTARSRQGYYAQPLLGN